MLRKCLYRTEPLWTRALLSIKIAKLVSYRKKNQTKRKQKPSSYTISPVSIQINSSSPTVKVTWFWPLVKDFVIFYRYCGCKDKKCRFFLVTWNLTLDEIKHTPIFNWESNGEMDEIRKFIFGLMWFSSSPQTLFYYYIRTVINSSTNTKIKVVCYKWNSILIGRTISPPPPVCAIVWPIRSPIRFFATREKSVSTFLNTAHANPSSLNFLFALKYHLY